MNYMELAIELAEKGRGYTATNPCVGAVVVRDGEIVGKGWHQAYGAPHAEPNALADAGEKSIGADLYVTLEPCSTYGKTPPCTEAIIRAGIKRVFIGVLDPNPRHFGAAVEILKAAGIEVHTGLLTSKCALLIEDFAKFSKSGIPYITMKAAESLDGKIATATGESKWITSQESLIRVHQLRKEMDAVLVGVGTVLADNPSLTVRLVDTDRQPLRVILDSRGRTPINSSLVQTAKNVPVLLFTSEATDVAQLQDRGVQIVRSPLIEGRLDLHFVLKKLGERNVMNLLVEGGAEVFGSFMDEGLVDRLELFIAPFIIGGKAAKTAIGGKGLTGLSKAERLIAMAVRTIGPDIHISGRLTRYM